MLYDRIRLANNVELLNQIVYAIKISLSSLIYFEVSVHVNKGIIFNVLRHHITAQRE